MKLKIIPNEQTPKTLDLDPDFIKFFIEQKNELLLKFMKFARSKSKLAAGLASNQVSCDGERIQYPFCAIKHNHQWTLAVNPVILKSYGFKADYVEGCLTWIGKRINVKRFPMVEVGYYNLKGEYITKKVDGFHAQIWQHEIDHLNGIEEIIM